LSRFSQGLCNPRFILSRLDHIGLRTGVFEV
jgi:hypothetical protein